MTQKVIESSLVKQEAPGNTTFLMATNPEQMGKAQDGLILWAEKKILELKEELKDHEENLAIAKKRKIRTDPYKRYIAKTTKRIEFYEKIQGALKEGYCVVPDMDCDLFAVRTTRKTPDDKTHTSSSGGSYVPRISLPNVESNRPPMGVGEYVSVIPFSDQSKETTKNVKGETVITVNKWATDFNSEIDFPFTLAKPTILDLTTKAMALKIFDEIGVLPRQRGADPVVVGRITVREGYQRKSYNFLIAWFLDTKDL